MVTNATPSTSSTTSVGLVVTGSLATGLLAAALLVVAPFVAPDEDTVTGAVLCGFALGWAMLAILSTRYTDQPQRWAMAPALFLAAGGLLLIGFGSAVRDVLDWVWPPLAAIGGGWQTARTAADDGAFPMAGRLIDVGGHRLHLHCTGSGSPTVVLQPGGGDFSSVMARIAPVVAAQTRVCVYDRAGRGWSDLVKDPQDANAIADDLHTLLQRGHVPGPYVMAGHSFGGLYVLTHADRYPDDVAGMVLIDATDRAAKPDPQKAQAYDGASHDAATDRLAALGAAAARVGLVRLIGSFGYGDLPAEPRDEIRAKTATADYASGWIDEFVQANASGAEAAMLSDFGDKPLVVLTAGAETDAVHDAAQDGLASLSANSSHRVVAGASHIGLITDERYSQATTRAILDVVSSIRTRQQLAP
jgi:pimeloyl-ACP methyl ester carboxylesterase